MASQVTMSEKKKAGGKNKGVTIRFELELAPPTEDSTNEFSYVHLLKERENVGAALKGAAPSLQQGSPDPLGCDNSDDNLAAIARRFEEKYGPKKRKRVVHESDLIDRGLGYDQTDSFVDDSEVYENFVPPQLDTRFGGFYVNMGKLEFKPAEDLENDDELDFVVNKKPKKPRVKKLGSFQNTPQAILASQKLKKAKQRVALKKPPPGATVGAGIVGNTPIKPPPAKKQKLQGKPKAILSSNGMIGTSKLSQSGSQLGAGTMTPGDSASSSQHTIQSTVNQTAGAITGTVPTEMEVGVVQAALPPKEPPVLPDQLPPAALEKVTSLEQLILKDTDSSGRLPVKARITYDEHLVEIHSECLKLSKKSRNAVFNYLAYKMGVARGTLIKRINQELKKREDTELEKSIANLKRVVEASMPEQIALYNENVAKARTASISEAEEVVKTDEVIDESTNASAMATNQQAGGQEKTKRAPPRKRFRWTDESRKLLLVVVKEKVRETLSRGNQTNHWEEIIGTFLDEKIKPLWPRGWMPKSVLYKTSEAAHKLYTNPMSKKAVLLKKDSPTLGRKELSTQPLTTQPPSSLVQAKVPSGQTTATLASSKNTLALDRKMAGMGSIKVLSGGNALLVGGAKTGSVSSSAGSPVRTIKLSSSPANVLATNSTQKMNQMLKVQSGNTVAVSSIHAKPTQTNSAASAVPATKPATNRRTAPTKSAKVTEALQNSNALTTYLLSAGTSGIAELLQAHINQKGGSIKIVPGTSGASSQGIQLVVSGANPRSVLAPSSAVAAGKGVTGVTSVSVAHGSKATPAAVDAGKSGSGGERSMKLMRPGGQSSAKFMRTEGQGSVKTTRPGSEQSAMVPSHRSMKITVPGDGVMRLGGEGSAMATQGSKVVRLGGGGGMATKAGGEGLAMATRPGSDQGSMKVVRLGGGGAATKAGGEGSAMVTKPGNTILARHQLATTPPGDETKLESVVNKIVSNFATPLLTQPPTINTRPLPVAPPLSTQPLSGTASLSLPSAPRLSLTKKTTSAAAAAAAPKIILPGLGETTRSSTLTAPPYLELLHRSTQSKPTSTAFHSTKPATPPLGPSTVSAIVIPDTPPQDLSSSSQSQTDVSPAAPACASPLESPMEQIIGEHSYPLTPEPS